MSPADLTAVEHAVPVEDHNTAPIQTLLPLIARPATTSEDQHPYEHDQDDNHDEHGQSSEEFVDHPMTSHTSQRNPSQSPVPRSAVRTIITNGLSRRSMTRPYTRHLTPVKYSWQGRESNPSTSGT